MQTFLPYASFQHTAEVLDRQRLGKQRVETLQIVKCLAGDSPGRGWSNHPAVKMWSGYEPALARYGLVMIDEWVGRGYRDTCAGKIMAYFDAADMVDPAMPPWIGDELVHASHRSNLLRKAPEHYGALGWNEPSDLPYVWPVLESKVA